MKRKPVLYFILAFVFCFSIGVAQAQIISMSPLTQDVGISDSVFIDISMDFAANTGGGIDIFYDNSILSYVGFTFDPLIGTDPIFTRFPDVIGGPGPTSDLSGELNGLAWGSFAGVGPGTVGTLEFTALILGTTNLTMAANDSPSGGFGELPTYSGAQVNVVPIPPTVLLLGAGLVGLVGIRRRKRS